MTTSHTHTHTNKHANIISLLRSTAISREVFGSKNDTNGVWVWIGS